MSPFPPLTGRPETKEIIYPAWRDTDKHLMHLDHIIGTVALWAVRQSPYDCPDDLEIALIKLKKVLDVSKIWRESLDGSNCWGNITASDIQEMLLAHFSQIPEIMGWNEKKVEGWNHGTDKFNPDHDFISLDALARNVSHSIILEILHDE